MLDVTLSLEVARTGHFKSRSYAYMTIETADLDVHGSYPGNSCELAGTKKQPYVHVSKLPAIASCLACIAVFHA